MRGTTCDASTPRSRWCLFDRRTRQLPQSVKPGASSLVRGQGRVAPCERERPWASYDRKVSRPGEVSSLHSQAIRMPPLHAASPRAATVVRLRTAALDDDAILEGVRAGAPAAVAAFVARFTVHVRRVLARILGPDGELADLHQDVVVRAIASLDSVRGEGGLQGWVTIIAVHVARSALERRTRRRWLRFLPWNDVPEVALPSADAETEALRRTYATLGRLPTDERIALSLRIIDGMELTEVAAACSVSLATVKRRIARGEARFLAIARKDEILAEWIDGGTRWSSQ